MLKWYQSAYLPGGTGPVSIPAYLPGVSFGCDLLDDDQRTLDMMGPDTGHFMVLGSAGAHTYVF